MVDPDCDGCLLLHCLMTLGSIASARGSVNEKKKDERTTGGTELTRNARVIEINIAIIKFAFFSNGGSIIPFHGPARAQNAPAWMV